MTNIDRPPGISDEAESEAGVPSMRTLVIRTWYERGQTPTFRSRVTYSETPSGEPSTISTADPDEVLSVVQQWLAGQTKPQG
jgi:hypothetical protein